MTASAIFLLFLTLYLGFAMAVKFVQIKNGLSVNSQRTLVVTGIGSSDVKPDTALIHVILKKKAPDLKNVQESIKRERDLLTNFLEKLGLSRGALETINYTILPEYETKNGVRRLANYNIQNELEISGENFNQIAAIDEELAKSEIAEIKNIQLVARNTLKARESAANQAIQNAHREAELLSQKLGVKLGKIISLREIDLSPPPISLRHSGPLDKKDLLKVDRNKIIIKTTLTYNIH